MALQLYERGIRQRVIVGAPRATLGKSGHMLRFNSVVRGLVQASAEYFRVYFDPDNGQFLIVASSGDDEHSLKLSTNRSVSGLSIKGVINRYGIQTPRTYSVRPDYVAENGECGFLLTPIEDAKGEK